MRIKNKIGLCLHLLKINFYNSFVVKRIIVNLNNSAVFDAQYYLDQYPDVKNSGMSAIEHYVKHGISEKRMPSRYAESLSDSELLLLLKQAGLPDRLLQEFSVDEYGNEHDENTSPPKDHGIHEDDLSLFHQFNIIPTLSDSQKRSLFNFLNNLFDYDDYLSMHRDLKGITFDPRLHYFKWGYLEQRLPCSPVKIVSKINSVLCNYAADDFTCLEYMQSEAREEFGNQYTVTYHSSGNYFFQELAEYICQGLLEAGHTAHLCDETDIASKSGTHIIVIAPHEYFVFDGGRDLYLTIKNISPQRTYYVTEQPQSKFGINQMQYLFDGSNIIDINLSNAIFCRHFGIDSYFLPVGSTKADHKITAKYPDSSIDGIFIDQAARNYDIEKESSIAQRPIDILYIGNSVPRRTSILAENSSLFNKYNSFIFTPEWPFPHKADSITTLNKNNALALCQRSKILLNIHRDEFHYFEWHRIVLRGLISGNVVITEPSYPVPGLVNGVHYLEYSLDEIPERIEYLLETEAGIALCQTISRNARNAFGSLYPLSDSLDHYFKYRENI